MIDWVYFLLSAAFVVGAGIAISRFAQVIAEKSGLGGLWVGSILLPLGTTLPELVTGVSSGWLGLPDLTLGNALGSCIFNVTIIGLADLLDTQPSLLRQARLGHILTAQVGILLVTIVALALYIDLPYEVGWIGVDSLLLAAAYFGGMRLITRYEARDADHQAAIPAEDSGPATEGGESLPNYSLRTAYIGFALMAVVIAVAGTMLSITSDRIAVLTGLGATFVGSTMLAISTSLPEVVSSVTAVRSGYYDLAVGNMLGSNLFNTLVLVIADAAYRPGPLFAGASNNHILTVLFSVVLSTVVAIGLFYRSKRGYGRLGLDSVAILIGYLVATYALYVTK